MIRFLKSPIPTLHPLLFRNPKIIRPINDLKFLPPQQLKSLISESQLDPNQNEDGYNLVHAVVETLPNIPELLPLLFTHGFDINVQDRRPGTYHNTPLMILIANECATWAFYFIQKARELGKVINFNIQDREGKTALLLAVKCRQPLSVLAILNEKKLGMDVDVNKPDMRGMTPLHYACAYGNWSMAQLLLDAGADINAKNSMGKRPVDMSCVSIEAIRTYFKEVGITDERDEFALSNYIRDIHGNHPVTIEKMNLQHIPTVKHPECILEVEKLLAQGICDVATLLIEKRIAPLTKPNEINYLKAQFQIMSGRSLGESCLAGQASLREHMIERGAEYDGLIRFFAANRQIDELRKLLVLPNIKEYINKQGYPSGQTALHYAASKGHADVCRMLLDAGASPGMKDSKGWTALTHAQNSGHVSVIECLEQSNISSSPTTAMTI